MTIYLIIEEEGTMQMEFSSDKQVKKAFLSEEKAEAYLLKLTLNGFESYEAKAEALREQERVWKTYNNAHDEVRKANYVIMSDTCKEVAKTLSKTVYDFEEFVNGNCIFEYAFERTKRIRGYKIDEVEVTNAKSKALSLYNSRKLEYPIAPTKVHVTNTEAWIESIELES